MASNQLVERCSRLVEEMAGICGPGVVVHVRSGGSQFSLAVGHQALGGDAAHSALHFRVGSVTKTAVAALALRLVAEGAIGLDAEVEGLDLPIPRGVTVRDLLQMRSGIPDYVPALVGDPPSLSPFLQRHDPRDLALLGLREVRDRGRYAYSNTNYVVLGLLLEVATSSTLECLLVRHVTEPLGLTNTYFPRDDSRLPDPHPRAYISLLPDAPPIECTHINPSESWASGSMISTGADLAEFLHRLLTDDDFLPPRLRTELFSGGTATSGRHYGLGITGVATSRGTTAWGHGGGVPGFMSFAYATTGGDLVVVLRNCYAEWANISVWNPLADLILGDATRQALRDRGSRPLRM